MSRSRRPSNSFEGKAQRHLKYRAKLKKEKDFEPSDKFGTAANYPFYYSYEDEDSDLFYERES